MLKNKVFFGTVGSSSVFTHVYINVHTLFFQLHSKLLETERQLGEAHGRLKEQRQLSSEKLMDKEQQVADLQLKLSRLEEQVRWHLDGLILADLLTGSRHFKYGYDS